MKKDPTEFRERFYRWKSGESVYEAGLPKYRDGKDGRPSKRARAMYNAIDPTQAYPEGYLDAAKMEAYVRWKALRNDQDRREWEVGPTLGDSVSDAAWRKRLGYNYNENLIIPNADGSFRLPKGLEMEIPTDTVMLKKRIQDNEDLMKKYKYYRYDPYMKEAVRVDKDALSKLRKTYKTGRPVVINEQAFNNRNWLKDGKVDAGISPLNVLQNYTIQYDSINNRMNYSDIYDFNEYDWAIPGKPFNIKGYVDLNPPKFKDGKDGDTIDGGTPFEITVTGKDRRPAWKRMYQNKHLGDTSQYYDKDALHEALSFAPVVGDAVDAIDLAKAIQDKNYATAGLLGAGLLLPNVIEKPAKAAYRGAKLLWNGGKIIQKNIPTKAGNFYRTVSKEAIDDAINTGTIRGSKQYKNTPYFSHDDILIQPRGKAGYVIEGTAETPVRWTSPYMKDTYTPIELLGDTKFANSVPEDFLQIRAPYTAGEAIPWFNGSTQVPTTGFNYWQKYPIIGWRQKSFDVTRP